MRYYIDTEFDGFGGELLSFGMVGQDGKEFYWVNPIHYRASDPWVINNVLPLIELTDETQEPSRKLSQALVEFFHANPGETPHEAPHFIADWPDDMKYLCRELITGPGTMINIPSFTMDVFRVDAYPTTLEGAVQHNALWDARALKHLLEPKPLEGDQS